MEKMRKGDAKGKDKINKIFVGEQIWVFLMV